jgi:hypothetical protein
VWATANLQPALFAPSFGILWASVFVRIGAPAEESRMNHRIGMGFLMTLGLIGALSFFLFAAEVFIGPSLFAYSVANGLEHDSIGSVIFSKPSLAYAFLAIASAFAATAAVRLVRRKAQLNRWRYSLLAA